MADWKGRGGGRKPGQPALSFRGGPGHGGGRAGDQPSVKEPSSAPSPARTSNIKSDASGTFDFSFGSGLSIKAAVNYGGSSKRAKAQIKDPTAYHRAGSTIRSASGEQNPRVADPEGNFIFTLEIDGIEVAQFKECSGLKSSTQVFELEEGGMNHRVHKLPGQSRWENITLRYGVTSDTSLLGWRNEILEDAFQKRRNGSVVMMTLQREEVRRYNFVGAWPVAWEGPAFDANAADLAVEMIEIAHHGISVS